MQSQFVREQFEELCQDVKQCLHLLTGNGTPEKGVLYRLANLERAEKTRSRVVWTAGLAAISAAITAAVTYFSTGNK